MPRSHCYNGTILRTERGMNMHMADALLAPAVAATMYAASAVTVGASVKTLQKDETAAKLPTMAVASALVFAGQMINYTIPGTGSSGLRRTA